MGNGEWSICMYEATLAFESNYIYETNLVYYTSLTLCKLQVYERTYRLSGNIFSYIYLAFLVTRGS